MLTRAILKHDLAGSLASASFAVSLPDVTAGFGLAGAPPPPVATDAG
ncbi:MAG: hypothetical protein WA978_05370 [Sphingopyxis granuli]